MKMKKRSGKKIVVVAKTSRGEKRKKMVVKKGATVGDIAKDITVHVFILGRHPIYSSKYVGLSIRKVLVELKLRLAYTRWSLNGVVADLDRVLKAKDELLIFGKLLTDADFVVSWKDDEHPDVGEVVLCLRAYLGETADMEYKDDEKKWECKLPGNLSRFSLGKMSTESKPRVFTVYFEDGGIRVNAGNGDPFTMAVARGFAEYCKEEWVNEKESFAPEDEDEHC